MGLFSPHPGLHFEISRDSTKMLSWAHFDQILTFLEFHFLKSLELFTKMPLMIKGIIQSPCLNFGGLVGHSTKLHNYHICFNKKFSCKFDLGDRRSRPGFVFLQHKQICEFEFCWYFSFACIPTNFFFLWPCRKGESGLWQLRASVISQ